MSNNGDIFGPQVFVPDPPVVPGSSADKPPGPKNSKGGGKHEDKKIIVPDPSAGSIKFKTPDEHQEEINREYVEQLKKNMDIRTQSYVNIKNSLADVKFIQWSFWITLFICLLLIGFGIYAGYSSIEIAKEAAKGTSQSEQLASSDPAAPESTAPEDETEDATPAQSPNTTSATITSAVLALLSAASFLGVFLIRPLDSLERNAILYPLVNGIVTMYWFQIAETNDNSKVKGIVADFVTNLGIVLDKHNEATKKYAELLGAKKDEPPAEEEEEEEEGAEKEKEKKEQEEKKASEDKKKEAGKKIKIAASFLIVGLLLARFFRVI